MTKIIKRGDTQEVFSPQKLSRSLTLAGAGQGMIDEIIKAVGKRGENVESTSQIFHDAFNFIVQTNPTAAARYSLERGIDSLGPTGFAFEQFAEHLFRKMGYQTRRNVFEKGQCATHEIDIKAEDNNEILFIEAKYRNAHNLRTHIDQVMYADARGMDIARHREKNKSQKPGFVLVITNTKFTENATNYAACRGLRLISWNCPANENLHELVYKFKLYPLTTLPAINQKVLGNFTSRGVILLQDLLQYTQNDLEKEFGIPANRARKIMQELSLFLDVF